MKVWLEREKCLDNPGDSTVVAKGQYLGHLVAVFVRASVNVL